jgi:xanthine dehydrogenase accessory factor
VELSAIKRLVKILEEGVAGTLHISPLGLDVTTEPPALERPPHRLEHRSADGWLYEEELLNRRRLAILGGGHCALALARLMTRLGYDVQAFETRKKAPESTLGQHVRQLIIVDDFFQASDLIDHPEFTWVVVMTSDFPSDVQALAGALPRPFPFLGVMGSPAKLGEIRKKLRERGFTSAELARLTAPVGLPIGSRTPEEIAVSVAAQILQSRDQI